MPPTPAVPSEELCGRLSGADLGELALEAIELLQQYDGVGLEAVQVLDVLAELLLPLRKLGLERGLARRGSTVGVVREHRAGRPAHDDEYRHRRARG